MKKQRCVFLCVVYEKTVFVITTARTAQSAQCLGCGLDDPAFDSRWEKSLFSSQNVQTDCEIHPASYAVGAGRGKKLNTHFLQRPRLRMRAGIPPHPWYAFMECTWTHLLLRWYNNVVNVLGFVIQTMHCRKQDRLQELRLYPWIDKLIPLLTLIT